MFICAMMGKKRTSKVADSMFAAQGGSDMEAGVLGVGCGRTCDAAVFFSYMLSPRQTPWFILVLLGQMQSCAFSVVTSIINDVVHERGYLWIIGYP